MADVRQFQRFGYEMYVSKICPVAADSRVGGALADCSLKFA